MIGPLTYLDAALLAVCFISGLLAMYRGFARELLSIVSWFAAAGVGAWIFLTKKELSRRRRRADRFAAADRHGRRGARHRPHRPDRRAPDHGAHFGRHSGQPRRHDRPRSGLRLRRRPRLHPAGHPLHVLRSFQPDEKAHYPWVRDAQSLPYIKSAGNTIRTILVQYAPSSLTNPQAAPPAGDQQGFLNDPKSLVALVTGPKQYYMRHESRT